MFEFRRYKALLAMVSLLLLVSACGTSAQKDSAISTSVAQTIRAGNSLTKIASQPTITPLVTLPPAETPSSITTPTTAASSIQANPGCTAQASLVAENPPDSVLLKPGETYWKTWTLLNTGTCTWTASYNLIFWNGDLMGGLTSYPLKDDVAPNEQKDISIFLKAPDTEGTYTGYWRLQTPWNSNFGVGPSDEAFYVKVAVSNDLESDYGISNVSYNLVRDPLGGCPTNVRYTLYVTITTNGPYEFNYLWMQSDGNNTHTKTLTFTEAGSQTVSREWMVGKGDSTNTRWIQFVVTSPKYQEYQQAKFENLCP
jgi:hypothetical protein